MKTSKQGGASKKASKQLGIAVAALIGFGGIGAAWAAPEAPATERRASSVMDFISLIEASPERFVSGMSGLSDP
jgi:hypothetical protein